MDEQREQICTQQLNEEELDSLQLEYNNLLNHNVRYVPNTKNGSDEKRLVNIRTTLVRYGRIKQRKVNISVRDLNLKNNRDSRPSKYSKLSEQLEQEEKRYMDLHRQGVSYKHNPSTPEEKEIARLYSSIHRHRAKIKSIAEQDDE